jgi:hypothetical protein
VAAVAVISSSSSSSSDTVSNEAHQHHSSSSTSSDQEFTLPKFPLPNPSIGDYVIVRWMPETRKKVVSPLYSVGLVLEEVSEEKWRLKCMRKYGSSLNKYSFPIVDDISEYCKDDIMKLLAEPKQVRSIYHFSDDFTQYSKYLR